MMHHPTYFTNQVLLKLKKLMREEIIIIISVKFGLVYYGTTTHLFYAL